MNRREAISQLSVLTTATLSAGGAFSMTNRSNYQIGACDWSLRLNCNPAAFDYAQKIGLEGVQVSYNSKSDLNYLSRSENRQAILAASQRTGVKIASLAIGMLNDVPLKSEAKTVEWVSESIDAAKALGTNVILLAFFGNGDLRKDDASKKVVIERLKQLTPKAEKQGIILGIESYLSAEEHIEIIEAVGSSNLQVYYDPRNSADAGYDIYKDIPLLGKRKLICEIHLKDNEFLLGQGTMDWPRIKSLLDESGYKGWAQIEWSQPKGKSVDETYPQNVSYAKKIFG
ncbi:sugar phosphate isomerase/epimerase family protein [Runella salmonicolor]|uniref:Sugar phosphate isomerase/epimerase n=1 Tax=Runella salmonicolor TaxID=2950278 RepID=A0ABT1FUS0_9BACT|nr:sugar phosphate isomerase/epimerase family protein [Runella salmonicolor]MCP1385515.1 sugar phosphate isomerase/epimerase [Runella salmonicolor]